MRAILLSLVFYNLFLRLYAKETRYVIALERIKENYVNSNLIQNLYVNFTKFNRTTTTFNMKITFKKSMDDVKIQMKAFKMIGNGYKFTGISGALSACDVARKMAALGLDKVWFHAITNLNTCPIQKGTYYVNNLIPNANVIPENFPTGKWMIQVEAIYENVKFTSIDHYLSIEKTVKW